MGSGNTGVIKGYMPDPSEVFRGNEIDMNKAKHQANSNSFVMGLDILGNTATQFGASMMSQGLSNPDQIKSPEEIQNLIDTESIRGLKADEYGTTYAAKGSGPKGIQGKKNIPIEAEKGEVARNPNTGDAQEIGGKSHEQGGTVGIVKKGTQIFSDELKVGGKSMAKREERRTKALAKAEKDLKEDPNNVINKSTYQRILELNEYEREGDLRLQDAAKKLDESFNIVNEGLEKFSKGNSGVGDASFGELAGDFFGGFTPGDYMGLAGNIYQGVTAIQGARRNAASDTPNENLFEGFGDDAIETIDQASGMLKGQQASQVKNLNASRNSSVARGRNSARGVNQMRAMDLAVDVNHNKALEDMMTNYSKMMMENLFRKSSAQMQIGQVEAQGATNADIANRTDKDNNDSQMSVAQNAMGTAIQQTGKDLNTNKRSRMLDSMADQLSKHGLKILDNGEIVSNK